MTHDILEPKKNWEQKKNMGSKNKSGSKKKSLGAKKKSWEQKKNPGSKKKIGEKKMGAKNIFGADKVSGSPKPCILPEILMRGAAELNCERSEHLPSVARPKKKWRCHTGAKDIASPNPECVLGTQGSRIRIFPAICAF
jgi:hypothetical protein